MKKELSWHLPHLYVKDTNKGKGLFASEKIMKDELVVILGGHVMTIQDEENLPEGMHDYALQIHEYFVFGPASPDEIQPVEYINHSCRPNCGFQGQIFIVAMRDIDPEEEITFDYAMNIRGTEANKLVYRVDCLCGEENCRKKITENDWKIAELRERYAGYFQPHTQKAIESE